MRKSSLPAGGENIFQKIKRKTIEAEKRGIKIKKLSIGQPQGPALLSARQGAAEAVMRMEESMHEYQDNGSPGVPDFARQYIQAHVLSQLGVITDIDFLPIPGIKPMLGLIPLACGHPHKAITVLTMSDPGYGVPRTWCNYLGVKNYLLPLNYENQFLFSTDNLRNFPGTIDAIMLNYPNNPSGQVAPKNWLEELCEYCERNNIRIINDAAYSLLIHSTTEDYSTLTDVAVNYPDLSWAEMFSASKEIGNGTGWRIGGIIGSPDLISDLKTIKGNTDSGFAAPMAKGVLNTILTDQSGISEYRNLYEQRLDILIEILSSAGMELVIEPRAGFFSLWKTPKTALSETITSAEQFNDLMIENTGIVGVPIGKYIRYSVAGFPVKEEAQDISSAFQKAGISYA